MNARMGLLYPEPIDDPPRRPGEGRRQDRRILDRPWQALLETWEGWCSRAEVRDIGLGGLGLFVDDVPDSILPEQEVRLMLNHPFSSPNEVRLSGVIRHLPRNGIRRVGIALNLDGSVESMRWIATMRRWVPIR